MDALIREMRAAFGDNQGGIRHSLAVPDCAEQILLGEGGDPLAACAAAVLRAIEDHGPSIPGAILQECAVGTAEEIHTLVGRSYRTSTGRTIGQAAAARGARGHRAGGGDTAGESGEVPGYGPLDTKST